MYVEKCVTRILTVEHITTSILMDHGALHQVAVSNILTLLSLTVKGLISMLRENYQRNAKPQRQLRQKGKDRKKNTRGEKSRQLRQKRKDRQKSSRGKKPQKQLRQKRKDRQKSSRGKKPQRQPQPQRKKQKRGGEKQNYVNQNMTSTLIWIEVVRILPVLIKVNPQIS